MTLDRLAAASGRPLEDVATELAEQVSAERDDEGRLVGLALTLRPTPPRFTVDGRTLHGRLFSSAAAATQFARAHPQGFVHPVEEAFRLDREVITGLGWEAR